MERNLCGPVSAIFPENQSTAINSENESSNIVDQTFNVSHQKPVLSSIISPNPRASEGLGAEGIETGTGAGGPSQPAADWRGAPRRLQLQRVWQGVQE